MENEWKSGLKYGKEAKLLTKAARQRDYRAAVTCMDASIGRILKALDDNGLQEDTLVVFMSDNGGGDNSSLLGHKCKCGKVDFGCLVLCAGQIGCWKALFRMVS